MNKKAVAMAADSAVTLRHGSKITKIYKSVHKIFHLNKNFPIGIMVYGGAEFLTIPWETIIKEYRKQYDGGEKKRVFDYGIDFIRFLIQNTDMIPKKLRRIQLQTIIHHFYSFLGVKKKGMTDHQSISSNIISLHDYFKNQENSELIKIEKIHEGNSKFENHSFKQVVEDYLNQERWRNYVQSKRNALFNGSTITPEEETKLDEILLSILTKNYERSPPFLSDSGVVISGFGANEYFPHSIHFRANCMLEDTVIYRNFSDTEITKDNDATILPYAQTGTVQNIVNGISPNILKFNYVFLSKLLREFPKLIIESIKSIDDTSKNNVNGEMGQILDLIVPNLIQLYDRELLKEVRTKNIEPMLGAVSSLPKDELGKMAETLVSLTSFKRKFSLGMETVGGPTDVAVISRGDGFIWIKRKHYFDKELNPNFFK